MAIEVGKIFEGTVTGLAKFGAFIKLSTGDTGLCHISEIADEYVKEVGEHLQEAQAVKVKVLSVDAKGKISLSIKQAAEMPNAEPKKKENVDESRVASNPKESRPPRQSKPRSSSWDKGLSKPKDFESMLNSFMKNSDEKLRSVKKAAKSTRRGNGHGTRNS